MPPAAMASRVCDHHGQSGAGAGAALVGHPEHELDHARLGKLGRPAEAAPIRVVGLGQGVVAALEEGRVRRGPGRPGSGDPAARPDGVGQLLGVALEGVALLGPRRRDLAEQVGEAGPGEVGAPEEGAPVGGQEHRHRPTALAGDGLHRIHVDGVDVGALLAVDLDVDEQLVHQLGGRLVLEGLVGHDVAPVTGRVADREQDGPVLVPRPSEGRLAPWIPVDRVVAVLEQVRARLVGQVIHAGQPTIRVWTCGWTERWRW